MNPNTDTYNIIKKEYGIITFEKSGLSFDEAYKLATPEYTTARYPNNNWHVMLRYAVYKYFLQINKSDIPSGLNSVNIFVSDKDKNNKTITVSYETKDENSNIKIKEFILKQLS